MGDTASLFRAAMNPQQWNGSAMLSMPAQHDSERTEDAAPLLHVSASGLRVSQLGGAGSDSSVASSSLQATPSLAVTPPVELPGSNVSQGSSLLRVRTMRQGSWERRGEAMLPHAPTNERTEAGMQPHEELSDVSTTSGYGDDDAHESDTGSSGETRKN